MKEAEALYIAICDDDAGALAGMEAAVARYASDRAPSLRSKAFSNAADMLEAAHMERFSHYFLDIIMPGMDGIAAAQAIRSFDADAELIFLTASNEFAWQSYRVHASDYLLKPVTDAQLFALLDRLCEKKAYEEEYICIRNGRSVYRIPFAQLSHVEVNQKHLYFHLSDGQLRQIPGAMAEYERELLSRSDFAKIHRSYIVNLRQISILSPDGCIMFSGENLPISRLLYKQVHRQYIAQLFGGRED